MNTKLISISKPEIEGINKAEDLISYCASKYGGSKLRFDLEDKDIDDIVTSCALNWI
jgi:hypothetical protein